MLLVYVCWYLVGISDKKVSSVSSRKDALYPVQVILNTSSDEHIVGHVRIHYVGYSAKFDEWRPLNDLVTTALMSGVEEEYDFNTELLLKVKSSLVSQRRSNPAVKIEITFNKIVFDEGLKILGYLKNRKRGIDHYTIQIKITEIWTAFLEGIAITLG